MTRVVLGVFACICGLQIGQRFYPKMLEATGFSNTNTMFFLFVSVSVMICLIISLLGAKSIVSIMHSGADAMARLPSEGLVTGTIGLICGLIISVLAMRISLSLGDMGIWFAAFFSVYLGYIGWVVGFKKGREILGWFHSPRKGIETIDHIPAILDTSVIIDGRIADICNTGFMERRFIVPAFVLQELQHIADSSDLLRRNRGRRGLDILARMQKELDVDITIHDESFHEEDEVDAKIVKLAKILGARVLTNDFNLNKVCRLRGISVLNLNDLANAVKPMILPGEQIIVEIVKDGKEFGQGVAYLDDGTMIVVEDGKDYIGGMKEVLVTSVLQTSAGRMIFAKPK